MPFPLREEDLLAAESALGTRFPESYRRKMLADNGGAVATADDGFELFRIVDRTDRNRFARTSSDDVVRENERARSWRGFPNDAIAIGENGGGDFLILLTDGSDGRAIFVWDHETAVVTQVAEDFGDLSEL